VTEIRFVSRRTEVKVPPHINDIIEAFPMLRSGCKKLKPLGLISHDPLAQTYRCR
jgi:hypothetical protein